VWRHGESCLEFSSGNTHELLCFDCKRLDTPANKRSRFDGLKKYAKQQFDYHLDAYGKTNGQNLHYLEWCDNAGLVDLGSVEKFIIYVKENYDTPEDYKVPPLKHQAKRQKLSRARRKRMEMPES
jgi:hypothetical protein